MQKRPNAQTKEYQALDFFKKKAENIGYEERVYYIFIYFKS